MRKFPGEYAMASITTSPEGGCCKSVVQRRDGLRGRRWSRANDTIYVRWQTLFLAPPSDCAPPLRHIQELRRPQKSLVLMGHVLRVVHGQNPSLSYWLGSRSGKDGELAH
jgi:hypothetical protein